MRRLFRLISVVLLSVLCVPSAWAQPAPDAPTQTAVAPVIDPLVTEIWDVLALARLMPVLQDEAVAEAQMMQQDGLLPDSDRIWVRAVGAIHAPDRLQALLEQGIGGALPMRDRGGIERALAFYRGGLGARVLALETAARIAMVDDDTAMRAQEAWLQSEASDRARVAQIRRLIASADLIEPNVTGGMNAAMAFSNGFAGAGGADMPMTEDQILADAWAQEPMIRAETREWLQGFLLLAYAPLSDAELDRYIDYATSAGARALSGVLFAGYDRLFVQTSHDMGVVAATRMQGVSL